jgi:uncharacterized SAM-binding protein YcdF (DUF218 family)
LILFTLLGLFFVAIAVAPRARVPLTVAAAVLFWLLATGWLSAPLLDRVQRQDAPAAPLHFGAHTVIVLLGSGTRYDAHRQPIPTRDALARIARSAAIHAACIRSGARCEIVVSGGDPQRHGRTEADTYLPYLLRAQVPRADILLENRSHTTYENARNVAALLQPLHDDTLILVTSAYQMRRALLDFHRFGLAPQPAIANTRHARTGWLPRYQNICDTETALHEMLGIAQFYVYRGLGWF